MTTVNLEYKQFVLNIIRVSKVLCWAATTDKQFTFVNFVLARLFFLVILARQTIIEQQLLISFVSFSIKVIKHCMILCYIIIVKYEIVCLIWNNCEQIRRIIFFRFFWTI